MLKLGIKIKHITSVKMLNSTDEKYISIFPATRFRPCNNMTQFSRTALRDFCSSQMPE